MALKLVTAPASEPLSLQEAKDHLRVWDDADDAYVKTLIPAARVWCETVLHRSLVTTSWRQTFSGLPACGVIELSRPPLIEVTAFQYIDADGVQQDMDESLYTVDSDSEPGRIVRGYGQSWPIVRTSGVAAPVTVEFNAGYGDAGGVPDAIKAAMKLAIGHWYENREMVAQGSRSVVPMAAESLLAACSWGDYP